MFVSILADDKVAALDGLHEMATLVRIVDILGRVAMLQSSQPIIFNRSDAFELHHRSQEARMLYIGLEKAMAALPKALVDAVLSGRGTSMQTLVFGTYHATTLKLVANLAYPVGKAATVQEPFFKISRDSIAASAKLAKAVVHAGRGSEMPPLLAWCLWVAARISFIDSYMMRCAPSQEFEAVLELLQVMSRTWALAGTVSLKPFIHVDVLT